MKRTAVVALGLSVVVVALAQDARWEPPPTPEGWKAVVSKDGRYRFVTPKDARGSGTRERTFSTRGFRAAVQVNYCTLKDGTSLVVEGATLTGSELRGMTVDQVLDAFLAVERENGFKVSEPKEATVNGVKAREYRLTNDQRSRRLVIFGAKPRVYALEVSAADPARLDTETANTFLNSFVLVPAGVVKAA